MRGLCGLDFGKKTSAEQKDKVKKELQVPILNNMALCLINQGHHSRAISMTDQVLKLQPSNTKALHRKSLALIEQSDYNEAEKLIKKLEEIAFQAEDNKAIYSSIKTLRAKMKGDEKQTEFSKNIFKDGKSLYDEKPNVPTKEERAAMEAEQAVLDEQERKQLEIEEEKKYLETLSNVQWFIYPFFKTVEFFAEKTCGCCKRDRVRIPVPNVKEKRQ